MAIQLNLTAAYASSLFTSCSGTGLVRSTPSLQTLAGFLSFMGSQQAEQVARALVLFSEQSSSAASSALELPTYNCCNFPANITEPGAMGNSSCPCASCTVRRASPAP